MSKIAILGAGESGAGAAVLAKKQGFEVFVSDMSKINDKYKKLMNDHQIEWEEGHHTEEKILDADEVIKSPGIPDNAPMIVKIKEKGIHIISEIEFAGRYTNSKITVRPLPLVLSTTSLRLLATMLVWQAISVTHWHCR